MKVIRKIKFLRKYIRKLKQDKKIIGFVPTMGYLHEGHLSLIQQARKECDIVVVSIFVNPLQFGPKEDFKKYPRDIKRDLAFCRGLVDIVFIPYDKEMYPENFLTFVEVKQLSDILCGASRPGHFRGVTTVVNKLFNIVLPDKAYFGQKDAQQAIIIKKMVEDLNLDISIRILPIIRHPDGLAMSSRNVYLSEKERQESLVLFRSLILAKRLIKQGERDSKIILRKMSQLIKKAKSARIDYLSINDARTLQPLRIIKGEVLILVAVFIGNTRLIDNMRVRV